LSNIRNGRNAIRETEIPVRVFAYRSDFEYPTDTDGVVVFHSVSKADPNYVTARDDRGADNNRFTGTDARASTLRRRLFSTGLRVTNENVYEPTTRSNVTADTSITVCRGRRWADLRRAGKTTNPRWWLAGRFSMNGYAR